MGIPSQIAQTLTTANVALKYSADIDVVDVGTSQLGQTVYYDNNILGTIFAVDSGNNTITMDASITTQIPANSTLQVSSTDFTTVTLMYFNIGETNYFVSDAYTPLTYGTDTYIGLGDMINFSEFTEDYKTTEGTVSIEISGIPAKYDFINIIQNERFKGATIVIQKAFMTSNSQRQIDEVIPRFRGVISNYNIEENTDLLAHQSTNTLLLTATSLYTGFNRMMGGQKTNRADRQRYVLNDTTFDNVVALSGLPEFG